DLVEAAKRHEVADAELQKNSVSGLAMEWSSAVAGEGRASPDDDIDAIRRVTPRDVDRVARLYLDQAHAVAAILTPRPSGKPIAGKGFGGAESLAAANAGGVKLPSWAEKAAERLNAPKSSLNPEVTVLPNGLKLVVQPESVSGTVSVYGRVDVNADLEAPKGREGVDRALDNLFNYGTTSLDRLAFQKALDDIAANESAGAEFSLQVPKDGFERGLALLAGNELDPALPEPDFKIVQRELAASVAGELKSPDHLASRAFRAGLFPAGDPSRRQATPQTVESLSIGDVRGYYGKAFRPDMTTLVVIGDVSPERARAAVEAAFGGWKASGPKPDTVLPRVPDNAPSTTQVPDSSRVQDKVSLGQTLALTRSDTDYYSLELGGHVLGGGFYASRLYQDLREKTGLVYFVAADFNVGRARGVFDVSYGCDPPNAAKARAVVVRDLAAMRDREVSPRELHQAKVLLLRHIPLSEASVDEVADGWLSRSILGLPLDEPVRAGQKYLALTAEDVKKAFAKQIRTDNLVQVVR
ncbi:MAG TPA: insulinase family protein, partial [Elusimicrobiota bacterium]|nr:insulinase family protein [Elusimicrobiota bacterium]